MRNLCYSPSTVFSTVMSEGQCSGLMILDSSSLRPLLDVLADAMEVDRDRVHAVYNLVYSNPRVPVPLSGGLTPSEMHAIRLLALFSNDVISRLDRECDHPWSECWNYMNCNTGASITWFVGDLG